MPGQETAELKLMRVGLGEFMLTIKAGHCDQNDAAAKPAFDVFLRDHYQRVIDRALADMPLAPEDEKYRTLALAYYAFNNFETEMDTWKRTLHRAWAGEELTRAEVDQIHMYRTAQAPGATFEPMYLPYHWQHHPLLDPKPIDYVMDPYTTHSNVHRGVLRGSQAMDFKARKVQSLLDSPLYFERVTPRTSTGSPMSLGSVPWSSG